ncbi:MAG: 2-dehydropantoate 2-reductase N-terminal domain-containing protein [Myxococcota bacterium]
MGSKRARSTPSARVLLVGQGSVGQVCAHALERAHVEVHALVRPPHAEVVSRGRLLRQLRLLSAADSQRLTGLVTHTSPDTLRAIRFDHVLLTMPSTDLRGAWFGFLVEAIKDAPLTMLQPGPMDRAYVLEHLPARRLIQGLIGFIAFSSPSPDAQASATELDATAFWYPPLSASLLDGPRAHTSHLVSLLEQGGMPVRTKRKLAVRAAMATAVLTPFLIGLELEGWDFKRLRSTGRLFDVSHAEREALDLMATHHGVRRPTTGALLQAGVLSMITGAAPIATPFELEAYLRAHFTKVGDQTQDIAATYLELAASLDHPMPHMRSMLSELRKLHAPESPEDTPDEFHEDPRDEHEASGLKPPRPT